MDPSVCFLGSASPGASVTRVFVCTQRSGGRCLHVLCMLGCTLEQAGAGDKQGRCFAWRSSNLCQVWSNAPQLLAAGRAAGEALPLQEDAVTVDTRKVIGEKGEICKRHLLLNSAIAKPFEVAADFHFKKRAVGKACPKVAAELCSGPHLDAAGLSRWGGMCPSQLILHPHGA